MQAMARDLPRLLRPRGAGRRRVYRIAAHDAHARRHPARHARAGPPRHLPGPSDPRTAAMTITVELLDPRHDKPSPDLDAFIAQQDLHPFWSFELLRIASWNSWSPVLLGVIRDAGEVVGAVC